MKYSALIKVPLAIVFILQPLVVYVAKYTPGDCDDKAVHFYSAMYFSAPARDRAAFETMTRPFVQAFEQDLAWPRTAFRLHAAGIYPLPNVAISFFHHRDTAYTESVKWGLFTATLLAVLTVALIGGTTPFGLWQTLLVLSLIAFDLIPASLVIGHVPGNMHPFRWYAPRGAGAVIVIAAILTLATGRRRLSVISLLLVFIWHAGLGLLVAGVVLPGTALHWVVTRYRLLHAPPFYGLFGLGLLLGPGALLHTSIVGGLVYFYSRHVRDKEVDFHHRAFLLSLLVLFTAIVGSAIAAMPAAGQLLQSAVGLAVASQVPARLSGVEYSLVVLSVVLAGRFVLDEIIRFARSKNHVVSAQPIFWVVLILITIGLTHRTVYARVIRRDTAFFRVTCQRARILPLPDDLSHLSLDDEPTLFLSFGHYLFRQNVR